MIIKDNTTLLVRLEAVERSMEAIGEAINPDESMRIWVSPLYFLQQMLHMLIVRIEDSMDRGHQAAIQRDSRLQQGASNAG